MSSPFQKAFMSKDPMKTIKLNDKDLKSEKSESFPQADLGVEGQGGTDYESPEYDNVEGQGGVDYEAEDYEAKKKLK